MVEKFSLLIDNMSQTCQRNGDLPKFKTRLLDLGFLNYFPSYINIHMQVHTYTQNDRPQAHESTQFNKCVCVLLSAAFMNMDMIHIIHVHVIRERGKKFGP